MKKFIIAALAIMSFGAANAQYTPEKGDFSAEIQFNPFSNDFKTFKLDGAALKGRYFITDKDAIRLRLGLNINSNSYNPGNKQIDPVTNEVTTIGIAEPNSNNYSSAADYNEAKLIYDKKIKDKTSNSYGSFQIGLGYERHWNVAKRVNLYAGAEIALGFGWASSKTVEECGILNADKTAWKEEWKETETYTGAYKDQAGNLYSAPKFTLGANIFTGVDFYVYKGLYLGAELGLGINYNNTNSYKAKAETTQIGVNPSSVEQKFTLKENNTAVAFGVIPALRLGWTF